MTPTPTPQEAIIKEFEKKFRHAKYCGEQKADSECICDYEEFKSHLLTSCRSEYRRGYSAGAEWVVEKIKGRARDEAYLNPKGLTVDLLIKIIDEKARSLGESIKSK